MSRLLICGNDLQRTHIPSRHSPGEKPHLQVMTSASKHSPKKIMVVVIPVTKEKHAQTSAKRREKEVTSHLLLKVAVPPDFSLSQFICSYGYFRLLPNTLQPAPEGANNKYGSYFKRPLVYGTPNKNKL